MKELQIKGYFITEDGKVWSERSKKFLKQHLRNKYYSVTLLNNGTLKSFYVHRLVAENFLDNPLNYKCVNHKNENTLDNNVKNLEWCNYNYNNNYGKRNENISKTKKGCRQYHLENKVLKIDKDTLEILQEYHSLRAAAADVNGDVSSISRVCNGERKTAYGYKWEKVK